MSDALGPPPSGKIIPLMPGISGAAGERRALLRAAVIQVVRHLVLQAVPPSQRVPLFDQATGLLDEAGWGLDELVDGGRAGSCPGRAAAGPGASGYLTRRTP